MRLSPNSAYLSGYLRVANGTPFAGAKGDHASIDYTRASGRPDSRAEHVVDWSASM